MSNTPWFRLYSEIMDDPKVLILPEALRWRYVTLLCMKCKGILESMPLDEIALAMRVSIEDAEYTLSELCKRNLIDKDMVINGWEKRQFISDLKDPTATERMKRYRENKRNDRNATVTLRSPESDTDTDTDKQIPPLPPKGEKCAQVPQDLPDWIPTDLWTDFVAMRKSIKKPVSPAVQRQAVKTLDDLRNRGSPPEKVLEQSILNCWQGLFEVNHEKTGRKPNQNSTLSTIERVRLANGFTADGREIREIKPVSATVLDPYDRAVR